jgi:hypothetical protein
MWGVSELEPWPHGHLDAWRRTLDSLRAEGWILELTTSAAPVQLEGQAPDGQRAYFRSRHQDVLLAVGGPDPADRAPWEAEEQHPEASCLPADDGLEIIRRLWQRYQNTK